MRKSDPPPKATYADLEKVPPNKVAELIRGVLHVNPRPAALHALAAAAIAEELAPPFKRGRGGPGGWMILHEPELHLQEDVLVPDLAGWRRERMPEVPDVVGFRLAPDWVCEVLSPSTKTVDREEKLPIYAREQVKHAWLVDPILRKLEIFRLEGTSWALVGSHRDGERIRAEPFDAIELDLAILWQR